MVCILILIVSSTCSLVIGVLWCIRIEFILRPIPVPVIILLLCIKSALTSIFIIILIKIAHDFLISVPPAAKLIDSMILIMFNATVVYVYPAVIHILLGHITARYCWYCSSLEIVQIKWIYDVDITWIECGFTIVWRQFILRIDINVWLIIVNSKIRLWHVVDVIGILIRIQKRLFI